MLTLNLFSKFFISIRRNPHETHSAGRSCCLEDGKVITSKYAGTKVTLEDTEYVVVRQGDILAIVE